MNSDNLSKFVSSALNFFLVKNPERTSIGVLFGIVCCSFIPAFAPLIEELTNVDLSSVPHLGWVTLGILVANISLPGSKKRASQEVEKAFEAIEEARRQGISEAETKQRYRLLSQKYAEGLAINKQMAAEIKRLKQEGETTGG
jgi:hypothetical protein